VGVVYMLQLLLPTMYFGHECAFWGGNINQNTQHLELFTQLKMQLSKWQLRMSLISPERWQLRVLREISMAVRLCVTLCMSTESCLMLYMELYCGVWF
jgi:hypothetical protein